jgi:hypothetical protein
MSFFKLPYLSMIYYYIIKHAWRHNKFTNQGKKKKLDDTLAAKKPELHHAWYQVFYGLYPK